MCREGPLVSGSRRCDKVAALARSGASQMIRAAPLLVAAATLCLAAPSKSSDLPGALRVERVRVFETPWSNTKDFSLVDPKRAVLLRAPPSLWSPLVATGDGHLLLLRDGEIHIWRLDAAPEARRWHLASVLHPEGTSGRGLNSAPGDSPDGLVIAASPQGDAVAVGLSNGDILIAEASQTLSTRSARRLKTHVPGEVGVGHIEALAFSQDGTRLVAGRRRMRFFDDGCEGGQFGGPMCFPGEYLAWDIFHGGPSLLARSFLPETWYPISFAFTGIANRSVVAVSRGSGVVRWAPSADAKPVFPTPFPSNLTSFAERDEFSATVRIASSGQHAVGVAHKNELVAWRPGFAAQAKSMRLPRCWSGAIAAPSQLSMVALGLEDGTVQVHSLPDLSVIASFQVGPEPVQALTWSAAGRDLITLSTFGDITLWRTFLQGQPLQSQGSWVSAP